MVEGKAGQLEKTECHEQSHRGRNELMGLQEPGLTRDERRESVADRVATWDFESSKNQMINNSLWEIKLREIALSYSCLHISSDFVCKEHTLLLQ